MLKVMRFVRYLFAFLLLGLAWAASAQAGDKTFTLTAPKTASPGQRALQIMLKDTANTQQLGSADITIPTGLSVVGKPTVVVGTTPVGTATLSPDGRTVSLRGLGLQPTQSATMTVKVNVPCASA